MELERATLAVRGMSCGHCVSAVRKALAALPGVAEVEVTLEPPRAKVAYDPGKTTMEALVGATEAEGYPSAPAAGE
jgi:copper chaperone CopZ